MLRCKFKFQVVEGVRLAEEFEVVEEFSGPLELAEVMAGFAAEQSGVRLVPQVMPLYTDGSKRMFKRISLAGGYGRDTYLVIKEVVVVE